MKIVLTKVSSLVENEYIAELKKNYQNFKKTTVRSLGLMIGHKNNIKKIDLIKMDIEGGEYNALRGMKEVIQKMKPVIIMEYNTTRLDKLNISQKQIANISGSL